MFKQLTFMVDKNKTKNVIGAVCKFKVKDIIHVFKQPYDVVYHLSVARPEK